MDLGSGMRVAHHVVTVTLFWLMSAFHGGAVWGQALPRPPDIVAKPPYLALVRAMREDELLLMTLRRQIESGKHTYKAECLANLRPGLVTTTIAWAMEPSISAQEVADAIPFFESEAGRKSVGRAYLQMKDGLAATDARLPALTEAEVLEVSRFAKSEAGEKLLVKNITRQSRVLVSLKAEVLDLLNICADTLEGTRRVTYCESEWVSSADKACSARYDVTGRAGDAARVTRVSLYCDFAGSDLSSLLTEVPGRHETIGLNWRESRTLEMLLPALVTPQYKRTADRAGLKYEYRARSAGDPPAAACVPTAPIDEFGWPTG
jgi:hypothetical protein